MDKKFQAVRSFEFRQKTQPISGFPMGYDRKEVWRVQMVLGQTKFTSNKAYANEASAKSAARRLNEIGVTE